MAFARRNVHCPLTSRKHKHSNTWLLTSTGYRWSLSFSDTSLPTPLNGCCCRTWRFGLFSVVLIDAVLSGGLANGRHGYVIRPVFGWFFVFLTWFLSRLAIFFLWLSHLCFFWKFFFFYVFESPNFFVIVNVLIQWSVSLHRSYLVYQSGRIGKTACLPQFQQNSNRSHPPAYVLNKFCNLFRKNEQQTFIFSKKLETHSRYHESVQNRSFVHLFRKNRFLTKNAVFLR